MGRRTKGWGLKGLLLGALFAALSKPTAWGLDAPGGSHFDIVVVSKGVALVPSIMRLLVIEEGRIRLFNLNGQQQGIAIPTRGEVTVAVSASRIIVADEGRVRIFDPNGTQQGLAISIRNAPATPPPFKP